MEPDPSTTSLTGTPSAALARRAVANRSPIAPGSDPYWFMWTDDVPRGCPRASAGRSPRRRRGRRSSTRPSRRTRAPRRRCTGSRTEPVRAVAKSMPMRQSHCEDRPWQTWCRSSGGCRRTSAAGCAATSPPGSPSPRSSCRRTSATRRSPACTDAASRRAAWLQSGVISLASFAISIPVALWVAAILLVNEVPDIRADAAAGKRTLVVRLGVATTRRIYAGIQLAAIAAFLSCGALGLIPWWMALPALLLLPQVRIATRSIRDVRDDRPRLTRAIETTLALHMGGSVLLVIAIVVTTFVLR